MYSQILHRVEGKTSMKIEKHSIYRIRYILLGILLIVSLVWFYKKNYSMNILSMTSIWLLNFVFAFENFKERMLFFWMQITIGVFLIVRPVIEAVTGQKWWNVEGIGKENFYVAVLIIFLSLLFMQLGAEGTSHILNINRFEANKVVLSKKEDSTMFRNCLQIVSMVVFYLTAVFFFIEGIEKILYVYTHSYLEYYSSFSSKLPWFISTIGAMMKYSMCIFLASRPRKRRTFFVLALFELSALPDLIVGVRGTIMLNSIFILVYYLIRDFKGDKEKWFGRFEKGIVIIGTPIALAFMTAYSFIRSGLRVLNFNIFKMIEDFFIGQGVTFEVVARGISVIDKLPKRNGRNYTFGQFIDYIVHGRIGQALFGTSALPVENSVINGTQSNSLSHNLSYVTKGKEYLEGQGWGSSYVLENYIDFGYVGVMVISLLLGALLIWMLYYIGKHLLSDTIIFISLLTIFYIPRAESTSWIMFSITLQFWVCVGCCWLGALISAKIPILQTIYIKMKLMPIEGIKVSNKKEIRFLQNKKVRGGIAIGCILALLGSFSYLYIKEKTQLHGSIEASIQTQGAEYENRRVTLSVTMEEKGNYQYQFSESFKGIEKIVQKYGEDNEYSFVTENLGEHTFYVDVKDEHGNSTTLVYHLEVKKRPVN